MRADYSHDGLAHKKNILVVHDAPAYRQGVALSLKGLGFNVLEFDSLDMSAELDWDACLLHIPASDMSALVRLRRALPSRPIVALLSHPTVDDYQSALRAGAEGLVAYDADLDDIGEVLRCALRGKVRFPIGVARALADRATAAPRSLGLSDSETDLLGQLASGRSIVDIANASGYSERHMYRLVQRVYSRIGARNRSEAIAMAAKWGLLTDADVERRTG
jgi:DNA-binding NarL/FixJ family response regulator